MASVITAIPAERLRAELVGSEQILPLENGDRLTRDEFERRYEAMPGSTKAELVEGVVYVPSPVRFRRHSGPHADLIGWLTVYRAHTPGVLVGDNGTVRLDLDNETQPDAFLLLDPACGGQATIDADDYVAGAPELVAEISSSSDSYDLHTKLNAYRRNGVKEYVVWRVLDRAIDWFILRGSNFERLPLSPVGIYQSEEFPGLKLDSAALLGGDMATVLRVLQEGIQSPEHAAFLAKLQQAVPRS
jgi:Uma2 family endonuclease